MKFIVSPAKSLNQEDQLPTDQYTKPVFEETAAQINRKLARMTKDEIAELMSISDKLADLNYGRYQSFDEKHTPKNSRPSIYMFDGDVYSGIDAYSIPKDKIENLQNSLRILSGMYGVLRPLDLIQPYRLEMGTKLAIESNDNLYELWQEKVTSQLNSELKEGELFVNLASQEYFKAVNSKKLKAEIISPVFKDFKNGKLKIISFYAKKARGLMVRYIIDHEVETLEGIKSFTYEDYHFSEEHTQKNSEPVFIR
ncbi:peroxide stress protein YaaA [Psychroflexus sp. CAK57W]|uniref:peroxide stress protein YaaA n=1 Tax=Psychroflexus curvus TaxID=2873595 RepID=UPI001CCC5FE9|nr:peroxide stress protein YaaA [Psychroflexus curvus]MBZ9626537.1 peroxide stress protein YaaA [Psychroflexus curvus]MBZ9786304.1 peroxide stress protein YaaA [Psychroflexus curvus]